MGFLLFKIYNIMKKTVLLSIILSFFGCADKKSNTAVSKFLTNTEVQQLKIDVVRYVEDLPRLATHKNKFDTIFNEEYAKKAPKLELMFAFQNSKTDTLYVTVSKIAPSIKQKRIAIGIKMIYDKNKKISFYQEKFRTWKMEIPELKTTTEMLFKKFIIGDDLSEYYTKNSKGKFIIEFPDDNNTFDTKSRQWIFSGNKDLLQK